MKNPGNDEFILVLRFWGYFGLSNFYIQHVKIGRKKQSKSVSNGIVCSGLKALR